MTRATDVSECRAQSIWVLLTSTPNTHFIELSFAETQNEVPLYSEHPQSIRKQPRLLGPIGKKGSRYEGSKYQIQIFATNVANNCVVNLELVGLKLGLAQLFKNLQVKSYF